MLLKIHIWFITIFLFKRNTRLSKWTRCADFVLSVTWVSILMHLSRRKQEFFLFTCVGFSWMATENGFDHQRNGDQKNLVFWIVAIENQDCDDRKFSGIVNFYFFDDQKFWLPNTSHPINTGSTSTADLVTKFLGSHFLQLNFFVTFFFSLKKNSILQ